LKFLLFPFILFYLLFII